MNSPYMGKFKVTQEFKGANLHDGLDLVGIDSKEIHVVVKGKVIFIGWENASNKNQGFGQYVKIKADNGDIWYYGHLSKILVKTGQEVKVTDVIGIEGSTGYSTGSHLHICCRPNGIKAKAKNVSDLLKIPNKLGTYDDGYRPPCKTESKVTESKVSNDCEKIVAKSFDKAISGTYKTTDRLNFRKSPNGEIMTVIPQCAQVHCYGYYTDDWYLVIYNNQEGFVSKQYLAKT